MKWTVGKRIGLLCGVALVGLVALTGLIWTQVDRVFEATNFANVNTVPSLNDIDKAAEAVAQLREGLWRRLAADAGGTGTGTGDTASTAGTPTTDDEAFLLDRQKAAEAALAKYEKDDMDEPPEFYAPDKANLDATRALLAGYLVIKDRVIALARADDLHAARSLLAANSALSGRLTASFASHRQLNIDYAADAAKKASATRSEALAISTGVGLATTVALALLGLLTIRSIVGPLQHAVAAARSISDGDLTVVLEQRRGRRDETGELLAALATMRDNLATIVQRLLGSAAQVATASEAMADGNQDLSRRTDGQAGSLQQTSASMAVLGNTVRHNADNAALVNQLAQDASQIAVGGGQVVGQVVETMRKLHAGSKRIADIVSVIDGIAFQTNILALNAAVEAARAGESGRGFAIVAGQVRSLAEESASAAREIKVLIDASVEGVDAGTRLADQAGATMTRVVGAIEKVTGVMTDISAAAEQQDKSVAQVGEAVQAMNEATRQNAVLVEQSAAGAQGLKQQAQQLVAAVGVFRLAASRPPPQGRSA